ncbi:stigma-specific STIG1-like protein 1 [Benincasa hispida]|uniref:stigma-specific STIG1-like protein 1 n=1 Tax=Benincasa hispida TaxID=102211 RepID=UPI001900AFC4|nr:stigma-specific STIG1-like protein 1 [Benincasa hispida]
MAIITFLAHIFLLISLSFFIIIEAEDFSPWLKGKLEDNDNEIDSNNHNRFTKHDCSGKQIFCRKLDGDGLEGNKKIMKCCKHRCVDTDSDVKNCGSCSKICPFPQQCCKGFCVDTNNSRFNCGKCGNRCRFRVRCVYGMCGYDQPDPPQPPTGWWKPPHSPKDRRYLRPVDGRRSSFA